MTALAQRSRFKLAQSRHNGKTTGAYTESISIGPEFINMSHRQRGYLPLRLASKHLLNQPNVVELHRSCAAGGNRGTPRAEANGD
jgi:hypothetical protein